MTKLEINCLKKVQDQISDKHLRECGFHLPDCGRFGGNCKCAPIIADAVKLYMDSWVRPLLAAVINEPADTSEYMRKDYMKIASRG